MPSFANKSIKVNKSFKNNSSISMFTNTYFNEYYKKSDRLFLSDVREMMERDPITRFGVEVCVLYLLSTFKEYNNSKNKIKKDINNSLINCRGNWKKQIRKFISCYWYGYSFTELAFADTDNNRKTLSEMATYDPLKYNFLIKDNKIDKVSYMAQEEILVPYETGIHLVIGDDFNFNEIYGSGRCNASLPYWELHKILMPVISLAAQRQATPILVKKTATGEDVLLVDEISGAIVIDPATNEPILIKKGWDSIQQLEKLGSAGITAIDLEDDLYSIELKVSHDFLLGTVKYCEQQRMNALLVPSTLFTITNSGVGDSGLSENHLQVFQKMIISMADFLNEELIENLIKPLIIYNFGEQLDYGEFIIEKSDRNILEIAKVAIDAVAKIPDIKDLDMVNSIRDMLGVSPLTNLTSDNAINNQINNQ